MTQAKEDKYNSSRDDVLRRDEDAAETVMIVSLVELRRIPVGCMSYEIATADLIN